MVRSIATQRRRAYYIPAPRRAIALNDRMRYIVERTYRRRFLTAEHILALIGALGESVQQTRRDLRDLADWGLLMRIRSPHKRRPNAGSTPLIYGIT